MTFHVKFSHEAKANVREIRDCVRTLPVQDDTAVEHPLPVMLDADAQVRRILGQGDLVRIQNVVYSADRIAGKAGIDIQSEGPFVWTSRQAQQLCA